MLMQILECTDNLHCVALHFKLVQTLTTFEQIVKRLICANFEENIYVFGVFEKVLKMAHIRVFKTTVNLNLRHKLLFCARLC